jgi:hypothetical protein
MDYQQAYKMDRNAKCAKASVILLNNHSQHKKYDRVQFRHHNKFVKI